MTGRQVPSSKCSRHHREPSCHSPGSLQTPDISLSSSRDSEQTQTNLSLPSLKHTHHDFSTLSPGILQDHGNLQPKVRGNSFLWDCLQPTGDRNWLWVYAPSSYKESCKQTILGWFLLVWVSGGPRGAMVQVPRGPTLHWLSSHIPPTCPHIFASSSAFRRRQIKRTHTI